KRTVPTARPRQQNARVKLRLDVTNTRDAGRVGPRTFEFDVGPVTVGRSSKSSVLIEGEMISRTHATLDLIHGAWQVTHQGSKTGTTLNGVTLPHGQPRRLNDGDVFGIDEFSIRVSVAHDSMPEL